MAMNGNGTSISNVGTSELGRNTKKVLSSVWFWVAAAAVVAWATLGDMYPFGKESKKKKEGMAGETRFSRATGGRRASTGIAMR